MKKPGLSSLPREYGLSADVSGKPPRAGGDLLFIYARTLDEAGTRVPDGRQPVAFTVEGNALEP